MTFVITFWSRPKLLIVFRLINSILNINHNVNCKSKNIVYVINDLICKVSSVGCTSENIKIRFRNHKSHIKHERRTCEISSHFIDNRALHILDRSSTKAYTDCLKHQIEIIIIEQVDVSKVSDDPKSRLDECKKREWYWQNQLKTLKQYGGLNVREERSWTYCMKPYYQKSLNRYIPLSYICPRLFLLYFMNTSM